MDKFLKKGSKHKLIWVMLDKRDEVTSFERNSKFINHTFSLKEDVASLDELEKEFEQRILKYKFHNISVSDKQRPFSENVKVRNIHDHKSKVVDDTLYHSVAFDII